MTFGSDRVVGNSARRNSYYNNQHIATEGGGKKRGRRKEKGKEGVHGRPLKRKEVRAGTARAVRQSRKKREVLTRTPLTASEP